MKIAGLQKLSTIDYPEHLSAVVFTNGCNYNCWYCHNRQLIDSTAKNIPTNEILEFLYKRKIHLRGVVISGGEPVLQDDLPDFIKQLKQMGYLVKLDTNGSKPAMVERCLDMLDYVAIDYKAPEKLYNKICSIADYEYVKKSLFLLGQSTVRWEVRTTLVPEVAEAADQLISEIKNMDFKNKPEKYRFNDYRKLR